MHTGERACGAYCPAMTAKNNKTPAGARVVSFRLKRKRIVRQTGGPGGDLLSHALRHSTIGAEGLNGRVRDGNGWDPLAITARSSKSPSKRDMPCVPLAWHKNVRGGGLAWGLIWLMKLQV